MCPLFLVSDEWPLISSQKMSTSPAYRQGLKEITFIDPESDPAFIEQLKKMSPEFADYFVEFAFGSIYSRTIFDPKVKELIAIATLTAMSYSHSHLKLHILGAFRAGCTKEEIMEVMIQSVIYVGFMKTTIALNLVKEVFDELVPLAKKESTS
jgi:4-carboxymuconolactone decarboxylase